MSNEKSKLWIDSQVELMKKKCKAIEENGTDEEKEKAREILKKATEKVGKILTDIY